jgi:hypothetical protein
MAFRLRPVFLVGSGLHFLSSIILFFVTLGGQPVGSRRPSWFFKLAHNVWQLQEVGDFGAQNCLPPLNLKRSTNAHLTTEPPISCRCFYRVFLSLSCFFFFLFSFQSVIGQLLLSIYNRYFIIY